MYKHKADRAGVPPSWARGPAYPVFTSGTYVSHDYMPGKEASDTGAFSGIPVSKRLCFGSQTLYSFPFFIRLLCLQLFSLSLWIPYSSALLDFRAWLWKRSVMSCGTQDRSRNVSSGPFPNYPHLMKPSETAVMALLWKGRFDWQFVLWLLIYFSFSCWSHDWLLLPSLTHAVQCCSAAAFPAFHSMQPHNFYHCEMLWHIGSDEKSV